MSRSAVLLALLSVCVVTGGCVGDGAPARSEPSATTAESTSTELATPTTSASVPNYDCPYHLQVDHLGDRGTSDVDRRIRYESLPEERQREFRDALESGSTEIDESLLPTWDPRPS